MVFYEGLHGSRLNSLLILTLASIILRDLGLTPSLDLLVSSTTSTYVQDKTSIPPRLDVVSSLAGTRINLVCLLASTIRDKGTYHKFTSWLEPLGQNTDKIFHELS
jgi:hypothetical protein